MKRACQPAPGQLPDAIKHVVYVYVATLAAALQMTKPHASPVNVLIQDAFLTHLRALMEFFRVKEPAERRADNILAVDFRYPMAWDAMEFGPKSKLSVAVNKTLSHLTYSRDKLPKPWDGPRNLHGTVRLFRCTWEEFLASVKFVNSNHGLEFEVQLGEQAVGWRLRLEDFDH